MYLEPGMYIPVNGELSKVLFCMDLVLFLGWEVCFSSWVEWYDYQNRVLWLMGGARGVD